MGGWCLVKPVERTDWSLMHLHRLDLTEWRHVTASVALGITEPSQDVGLVLWFWLSPLTTTHLVQQWIEMLLLSCLQVLLLVLDVDLFNQAFNGRLWWGWLLSAWWGWTLAQYMAQSAGNNVLDLLAVLLGCVGSLEGFLVWVDCWKFTFVRLWLWK